MNHFLAKRLLSGAVALGCAATLVGCSGSSDSRITLPTIDTREKIVFVRSSGGFSNPTGSGPIWIVDADGKNAHQLTSGNDSQPALFKNRIAFTRGGQLWVMNADGSDQKQLNTNSVLSFRAITDPVWKPNGEEITFAGQETRNGFVHIYSLILRDNSIVQYTGQSDNPNTSINPPSTPGVTGEREYTATRSDEYDPEWSSDGTQLVFATDRHYRLNPAQNFKKSISELYKLTFSSSFGSPPKLYRLTRHLNGGAPTSAPVFSSSTGNPIFSPDGTKVIFESSDATGRARLYSIPSNGTALTLDKWTAITTQGSSNTAPTYKPESHTIALSRDGDIIRLPDNTENSKLSDARLIIKQGVQPSWGRVTEIITPTPTPRPTTTPTPRPTTVPTTRPTTAPTVQPTTGSTQSVNLSPQETKTFKRVSSTQVDVFNDIAITGDHEVDGSSVIQAFGYYSISGIPAGATIRSATLNLLQGAYSPAVQGNPFGTLGGLYVEGTSLPTLSEGALASNAVLVSNAPQTFFKANVTALVQTAVNARNSQFLARMRFQKPRNNNGTNDNYEIQFAGLEITYTR